MWTQFIDCRCGQDEVTPFRHIYINQDQGAAIETFRGIFGVDPLEKTKSGYQYMDIEQDEDLAQLSGDERNCDYNEVYDRYVEAPGSFEWLYGPYQTLEEYAERPDVAVIYMNKGCVEKSTNHNHDSRLDALLERYGYIIQQLKDINYGLEHFYKGGQPAGTDQEKPEKWTVFWRVCGDGRFPFKFTYIHKSKDEAINLFMEMFGDDPLSECEICGKKFHIEEHEDAFRISAYPRGCRYDKDLDEYFEEPELPKYRWFQYEKLSDHMQRPDVLFVDLSDPFFGVREYGTCRHILDAIDEKKKRQNEVTWQMLRMEPHRSAAKYPEVAHLSLKSRDRFPGKFKSWSDMVENLSPGWIDEYLKVSTDASRSSDDKQKDSYEQKLDNGPTDLPAGFILWCRVANRLISGEIQIPEGFLIKNSAA